MQTQTHRADACTPTLLQAAIAAAEVMAEQAERLAEAILHEPQAQDVVLPPMGRDRHYAERRYSSGGVRCEFSDGAGNTLAMIKRHERPDGIYGIYWHPAHWSVHECRVDGRGNTWGTYLGEHVMDDFGSLVEVTA